MNKGESIITVIKCNPIFVCIKRILRIAYLTVLFFLWATQFDTVCRVTLSKSDYLSRQIHLPLFTTPLSCLLWVRSEFYSLQWLFYVENPVVSKLNYWLDTILNSHISLSCRYSLPKRYEIV